MNDNNIVLDRIKVLNVINILEPVTKTDLLALLKKDISLKILPSIIKNLLNSGLISVDEKHYRVTRLGMSLSTSRKSKTLRDIYRMNYLISSTKAKGR